MGFKIISGNTFEVNTELSTDAWNIFQKYVNGTATEEELALITDLGVSSFEVRHEGDAVDPDNP